MAERSTGESIIVWVTLAWPAHDHKALFFLRGQDQIARMPSPRRLHGSCVARNDDAILLVGPPGSGKSDLALRLLSRGFDLVADDQVDVDDGVASCPEPLAGLLESRGLGIVRLPYRSRVRLALIVDLTVRPDRMPMPRRDPDLDLPVIGIDPASASAADKIALALDCATGRVRQVAGAFAA